MIIRSFLYLDSQKLRSASSQLFEGVANYVVHSEKERTEETEQQKGPVASGRLLGDIFAKEKSSSEMRFLEDHAYSIFEGRLGELDLIEDSLAADFSTDSQKAFFKITNNLRINDVRATNNLLEKFNEIGEALARTSLMSGEGLTGGGKQINDNEIKKIATSKGLQLDAKFVKSMRSLISFGLSDVLEASLVTHDHLFTAPLKREFLRETAEMILYKFSRVTQQKFSMLGTVTQRGGVTESDDQLPDVKDAEGVKMAMRTLSLHMRTVEQVFLGPLSTELVIDPIAIYTTT
ncbi:hypothetical protein [Sphingobium sp. CECT 9361]|uniref:DUF6414 family protein n=1 Tax=Sphingobium sp. CECT 9361 TaxID=2845384 RepID=UPI001E397DE0|nr:hypothetical protein [Sphingobium sp. CECT 9361]CAH0353178.1 hypothetical protein SPH9361_02368 [Sphingobium sp. CECT 9361]